MARISESRARARTLWIWRISDKERIAATSRERMGRGAKEERCMKIDLFE